VRAAFSLHQRICGGAPNLMPIFSPIKNKPHQKYSKVPFFLARIKKANVCRQLAQVSLKPVYNK
jgi:hypothetical protein